MKSLGRLFTAMITPYDDRGAVAVDEAVRIAKFLVDRGNDGVVVAGTTGESPALETDEKLALFGAIKAGLGTGGTVIAGSTGNNTHHSVELTQRGPEDRRRCDPRNRAVLQQADARRPATPLRRDR